MRRLPPDALLPAIAAACGAAVLVLPLGSAARGAAGIVLVAILPGAAFSRAVLSERERTPERVLVALGISAAVVALASIALDAVGLPLEPAVWAPVLALLTAAASGASILRRRGAPAPPSHLLRVRRTDVQLFVPPAALHPRRVRRTDVLLFVLAVPVICAAVWLSTTPLGPPQGTPGYTSLWMEPNRAGRTAVIVSSAEMRPTSYRLVVQAGQVVVASPARFRLDPGQRHRDSILLPRHPGARVTALLYRLQGGAAQLYRLAELPAAVPAAALIARP
jgi:uncharacterized membrane protein